MSLYNRNFNKLTKEEIKDFEKIKEEEKIYVNGKQSVFKRNLYSKYPKAVRHHETLFPNNFLDAIELSEEKEKLTTLNKEFLVLLNNTSTNERDVLNFIKDKTAYFIIGSILKNYNFGHHEAYIFPEFSLGTAYKADYLIIGKGSGGYEFVLVELESVYGKIIRKNGELGYSFNKGIDQVKDWNFYMQRSFSFLREEIKKKLKECYVLPGEFTEFDSTRIHYVVVAGRRTDFNEKTYRLKREFKIQQNILLLHYDNLFDNTNGTIGNNY